MSIHESELLVDYLLLTTATDEFTLCEHCFIIISFYVIFRFGIDIEAEKFPARQTPCMRIADCGPVIEIQRQAAFCYRFLPQIYLSTCSHSFSFFCKYVELFPGW